MTCAFPRLCNGSTSDSGSDCGGSNPPWGILFGPFEYRFSSPPSQGGEMGSTPVGTVGDSFEFSLFKNHIRRKSVWFSSIFFAIFLKS